MADLDFIQLSFYDVEKDEMVTTKDLNLYVVANGGRYAGSLTPQFENRTTSIPGRPGLIYWGTTPTNQEFNISFATDGITGVQLNLLKKFLNLGKPIGLSFEEAIYKRYMILLSEQPIFTFIPFKTNEKEPQTLYKGEIEARFMTLAPYAFGTIPFSESTLPIYDNKLWRKESGVPRGAADSPTDNRNYYLADGEVVRNGIVVATPTAAIATMLVYHAGNTNAETYLKFNQVFTLGNAVATTGPRSNWEDLTIDNILFIKPRFLKDIEFALQEVYNASSAWAAKKEAVLNVLRGELDGPAKETILYLVNGLGAGYSTFTALVTEFRDVFFTGAKYTFHANGMTGQHLLTVEAKQVSPTLVKTVFTYEEDNTGSTNSKFLKLKPSGQLPIHTGAQTVLFSLPLTNVVLDFKNTYI